MIEVSEKLIMKPNMARDKPLPYALDSLISRRASPCGLPNPYQGVIYFMLPLINNVDVMVNNTSGLFKKPLIPFLTKG